MKLDWMYQGPGGAVDREEYLLGRAVDRTLEDQLQAEKSNGVNSNSRMHPEYGEISNLASTSRIRNNI